MRAYPGEILLVDELADRMLTPRLRSIAEFAEQEIVAPDGPYAGFKLKLSRSPAARLLYTELDSGRWRRAFVTGPNQDGKSLFGFVVPTMYALFERRERVIAGVPSIDIVGDKWRTNLLPTIAASRYREYLPSKGSGSRGGDSVLFEFGNGSSLRFMTAGGGDQARAGMSTPNLHVTETDGFDVVGGSSREGDKFSQLERRTLAEPNAKILAECTVSTEAGRTWREIKAGSDSRIAIPCPHCAEFVTPEREHLKGWQEAETERQAVREAYLACPACGAAWTNDQRMDANQRAVLVHKGQTVGPDGVPIGPLPDTDTLGFRWTAVNCVLNPGRLSSVAGREWRARTANDAEAAERDVLQSQWAMPAPSTSQEVDPLNYAKLMQRVLKGYARGVCPPDTTLVTVGIDVGKWMVHWTALAWRPGATPHAVDYGVVDVPSALFGEETAILTALRALRDETLTAGWKCNETRIQPTLVFVDAGYKDAPVQAFCAESGPAYFATKGFGFQQRRTGQNARETGTKIVKAGEKYSVVRLPSGLLLVEINADAWKSFLHARVQTPVDQPGAFTLFDPNVTSGGSGSVRSGAANYEHMSFARHMTAERQVDDWDPKEGSVIRWEAVTRKNHWLDSTALATVAGHAAGVRLNESKPPEPAAPTSIEQEDNYDPVNKFRGKW